ncbi:MAG: alanine--tRNA ligase, partial [Candidatus Thermoplasmatota archaeon]|nr:alanine--tRNA ligase [Candidatus Thermoplasmatota archaeon]
MKLTANQIRTRFLEYFKQKQHAIIPSASVIPENDPTLLFTNSGMHPLVPYLMGEPHPEGARLANSQKCVRTIDIDEVGDNSHLTFFEMLGFWSLGDYFKKDTIKWTYEFLTDADVGIGLDPARIYITCFNGENQVEKDEEAAKYWKEAGIPENRIYYLGCADNWWELPGKDGPCGPDTEIFYDMTGKLGDLTKEEFIEMSEQGKVVEIGNDVFMEYVKGENGAIESLPKKNVDVGWGFERLVAVVQGHDTVFNTDLFQPLIQKLEWISKRSYQNDENARSMRIIVDHLRTATFIIGDQFGVGPSNIDQGYIVRRLIRRAIREGKRIGINDPFVTSIVEVVIDKYKEAFIELEQNTSKIIQEMSREEEKFQATLDKGLKEFKKILAKNNKVISGHDAFLLFATYGFPIEITVELAVENNAKVDEKEYIVEYTRHQKASRAGADKKFKGGLADDSEQTKKLHTATHLLHQALKQVLGAEIEQKGSNINPQRLRFDFNYSEKLSNEQKEMIEALVNDQISRNLKVYCKEVDMEQAIEIGAIGYFDDKYAKLGNKVKVYCIGEEAMCFSKEICGGPHVDSLGQLGIFKITSEKSAASGIRRIKAV